MSRSSEPLATVAANAAHGSMVGPSSSPPSLHPERPSAIRLHNVHKRSISRPGASSEHQSIMRSSSRFHVIRSKVHVHVVNGESFSPVQSRPQAVTLCTHAHTATTRQAQWCSRHHQHNASSHLSHRHNPHVAPCCQHPYRHHGHDCTHQGRYQLSCQ
jgi:hypothetical protein